MMQFLRNLWSGITSIYDWFSPDFETFPDNEAGDLMRRYMARKSWFDEISSNWCERGFFNKLFYSLSTVLIGSLIGVIFGAPTIIAISVAVLICFAHTFLIAHEKNRRAGAKIFAEESLGLSEILQDSTNFFKTATNEVSNASQELKALAKDVKEHSIDVGIEAEKLKGESADLSGAVVEIQAETSQLVLRQGQISSSFEKIADHIDMCDKSIVRAMEVSNNVRLAAVSFSEAVQTLEHTHNKFSHAVDTFCLFVNDQAQPKTLSSKSAMAPDHEADEFLNHLLQQNEEDDRLLVAIGLNR
jgi:methyl-accepting chemotaxis protein